MVVSFSAMGKKKRRNQETALPIFFAKKRKITEEMNLTALVALHKYCSKFKIGTPGFRQRTAHPFSVVVVLDGTEFGSAKHADKDAAMEKASLLTLNLLDPEGKSIIANIPHTNEGELKALQLKIANAKQDGQSRPAPAAFGSRVFRSVGRSRVPSAELVTCSFVG